MPRKIHALSDQTKKTLTDNVQAFANKWDCGTNYVNKILDEERTDFYPPFKEAYIALLEAGISTAEYDSDLEFERQRRLSKLSGADLAESFQRIVRQQNRTIERYIEAGIDGKFDLNEIEDLHGMVVASIDAMSLMLQGLKMKRERLEGEPKLRPVS